MKGYTHNLKLVLCDNNNQLIENSKLLNQIKNKLISQDYQHWYISNSDSNSYIIRWIRIQPSKNDTKKTYIWVICIPTYHLLTMAHYIQLFKKQ